MCWFVKPSPMLDFMHKVSADPALGKAYKANPQGVLDSHAAAAGLSNSDKALLLSGDSHAVLSAIAGKHA